MPEEEAERQKLLTETLEGGPDLERRPEYWDLYRNHADSITERGMPLSLIAKQQPKVQPRIDALIEGTGVSGELQCIPVIGKLDTFCFIVEKANGNPVGLIDIDPWTVAIEPEQNG